MALNPPQSSADVGIAIFGALAIGISGLIAVALIPTDYSPPGALFWPAAFLSVGLCAAPVMRVIGEGFKGAIRAENYLLLGIIYWVLSDLLQVTYPIRGLAEDDVIDAFAAITIFGASICLAPMLPRCRLPGVLRRAAARDFSSRMLFNAILLSFALGIFYYAYSANFDPVVMIDGLFLPRFSAPWARGDLGGWNSFVEQLTYFGYVLPCLTVLLALRSNYGWANSRVILSVILTAVMIAFLAQGGGRRVVGMNLGSAMFVWLLLGKNLSVWRIGVIAIIAIGILNLLQFMLIVRNVGIASYVHDQQSLTTVEEYYHVDDNFIRLAQIIHFFPTYHDYVGTKQISYVLVRPIPRALWVGKPMNGGIDLPLMLQVKGVSLSSSIIGELYASWGRLAVLVGGVFLGWVASSWNQLLRERSGNSRVLFALGVMMLFISVRSMEAIVVMLYPLISWVALSLFIIRRHKSARRPLVVG